MISGADACPIKSALLPLSPFESWLEGLIERLPRSRVVVQLVPVHHIEVVDSVRGEYKSLGESPSFDMQMATVGLGDVWLYIEGTLVRNSGNRQARIEGTLDGEPGSVFSWPITTNLRGTIREVVFLPRGVRHLRWIPTTSCGFFSQSPLLVHRVGSVESGLRRWHRVLATWGQSRRRDDVEREGLSLGRAVFNLQCAYRKTALIRAAAVRGNDYSAMVARMEKLDMVRSSQCQASLRAMVRRPVFSLLIVIDRPDQVALLATVRSMERQVYPHWELLLLLERPTEQVATPGGSHVGDPRIRWVVAEAGRLDASAISRAFSVARGDYLGLLGAGDVLLPHGLGDVALALDKHPGTAIVYGDEDSIALDGLRVSPRFKPDWNPDLLLSTNYVGLPVLFRRGTAIKHGLFSSNATGAESYDLLLRLMAAEPDLKVLHVPRILCSRRVWESDTDTETGPREATPYGTTSLRHDAELLALERHLAIAGASACRSFAPGFFRVRHPLPTVLPLVSLIVPTRDRLDVLRNCISSIQSRTTYPRWELLVVNNGSSEQQTLQYLQSLSCDHRIRVLDWNQPFNYSALNNYAVGFARGEVLGLLNNDLEVIEPDWLSEMVSHAIRPSIGAVGAKLLYPDGMVQHAGVILGIGGVAAHVHKFLPADAAGYEGRACVVQNLSAVTGACLVVKASLYRQVGGMDEMNLAVAFNDIDFCLKLCRAGYRNLYSPHAVLVHHESISRGRDDTPQKRAVFDREYSYMRTTWREQLTRDPAYNPNFSLEFGDFSFASQPWVEQDDR